MSDQDKFITEDKMETAHHYAYRKWMWYFRDCESCDHNDIESGSMLKERVGIEIEEISTKVVVIRRDSEKLDW